MLFLVISGNYINAQSVNLRTKLLANTNWTHQLQTAKNAHQRMMSSQNTYKSIAEKMVET